MRHSILHAEAGSAIRRRLQGLEHLDERADDAQAGEAQVLEGPRFADGVQEGVEEERHVRCVGPNHASM